MTNLQSRIALFLTVNGPSSLCKIQGELPGVSAGAIKAALESLPQAKLYGNWRWAINKPRLLRELLSQHCGGL